MFSVFAYMYAKYPPSTLYGNAFTITFTNVTSNEIVCNSPKHIADTITKIFLFLMILCISPLNIVSSTIGAYITANGITYQLGKLSKFCWFTDPISFVIIIVIIVTTK